MPIVWDAELGKYVAKKAAPVKPASVTPPPEPEYEPEPSFEPMADVDIPTLASASAGSDHAALQKAITAAEQLRRRAEIAEAKAARMDRERQSLQDTLATGTASAGQLEQIVQNKAAELARKNGEIASKAQELKARDAQIDAKSKEMAELQAQHKAELARGRDALEAERSKAKAAAEAMEASHASTLSARDEAHRTASAAAQEEHAVVLQREMDREREEQLAAYEQQLAELKAAFARESAEVKRGHTKEMAELLAALNKQREQRKKHKDGGGGAGRGDGGDAHSKGSAKTSSVINKAQAKAESWEIANLGRNHIELVHLVYERLENIVAIADEEARATITRLGPDQVSSEDAPVPTELKTRGQAHAAMEELDVAREQLYAQLYSHDNMLGYHYLKNYPMTPRAPAASQNYRRLSHEFAPAPAPALSKMAAPATAAPVAAASPAGQRLQRKDTMSNMTPLQRKDSMSNMTPPPPAASPAPATVPAEPAASPAPATAPAEPPRPKDEGSKVSSRASPPKKGVKDKAARPRGHEHEPANA